MVTDPMLLPELTWGEIAVRLGAALACAGAVGLDRQRNQRPAGLRTMMLVGLGSATFTVAGYEIMATLHSISPGDTMSRVIQGIVGGIGFLGAGTLLQSRGTVKGVTTAAAIWVTAALGVACGLGLYRVGLLACGATLFTLVVLRSVEKLPIFKGAGSSPWNEENEDNDGDNGDGKGNGQPSA